MFGSVVADAFQITFRVKIHANDVFLFFKNYFWYQYIKTIQTIQIILNFNNKKKFFKFFKNTAAAAFPNVPGKQRNKSKFNATIKGKEKQIFIRQHHLKTAKEEIFQLPCLSEFYRESESKRNVGIDLFNVGSHRR